MATVTGLGLGGTTARRNEPPNPNPVISEALLVVPEVVYSPMVPLPLFATNRSAPESARPSGPLNPLISEALMVAPEIHWHSPDDCASGICDEEVRA